MTSQEARTFNHFSAKNAAILEVACDKCQPYEDWFTYRRWEAQGEQVAKGQHGTKLLTIIETEEEGDNKKLQVIKRPWQATVFCRHQLN